METEGIFDFETNGIEKGFSYPHQLAIGEIDSKHVKVFNNRILTYDLPNPRALFATNMKWEKLLKGPSLYEVMPEMFLALDFDILWGWNVKYDSGVLEDGLFSIGYNPYIKKTDGTVICDAMSFTSLSSFLEPEKMKIPINEKGKPTLKLEKVYIENFGEDSNMNWHQADFDVEGTRKLLKKIEKEIPNLWNIRTQFFNKYSRQRILTEPKIYAYYLHFSGNINFMKPVLQREDGTGTFSVNLNKFGNKNSLTANDKKKLKEGEKPSWLAEHFRNMDYIIFDPESLKLDVDTYEPNDEILEEISDLISLKLAKPKVWKEPKLLEHQKFNFPIKEDKQSWDLFHKTQDWDEKVQIKFKDMRSKRIAQRLIYDNAPGSLDTQPYKVIEDYIKERWLSEDPDVPWVTIPKALKELENIERENGEEALPGYKNYLINISNELKKESQ